MTPVPLLCNIDLSYGESSADDIDSSDEEGGLAVEHGEVMDATIPSCFTTAEQTIIDGVMLASIAPSTQRAYAVNWKKWVAFVEPRGLDVYLTSLTNDDRIKIMVLFSATCKTYRWDFSAILSSLKHQFTIAFQASSFLSDPILHKASTATKPNTKDESVRALHNVKLLIPYELIVWVRENYFTTDTRTLTSMMIYLATAVSYTFGFRFSNVGHDSNTQSTHAITAKYVTISISKDDTTFLLDASELGSIVSEISEYVVLAISFTVLSSKSVGNTALKNRPNGKMPVSFTLSRDVGGPSEIQLIEDLISWMSSSSRQPDDLFFSYQKQADPTTSKRLIRTEMATAIKAAASACGLDPKLFSTKSNRKAHATELGVSSHLSTLGDKALNKHWSKSSTAVGHYIGNSMVCPNTLTSVDAGTNQSLEDFQLSNAIVLNRGTSVPFSESDHRPVKKRIRKNIPKVLDGGCT